ncbi:MAG: hypothetical protein PHO70_08360 [Candidatus Omnitrophica bacterium]|nr:hypothetical protein [Candidatus Omnitrophota bacterium]
MSQGRKTRFDEFMELSLLELKRILASGMFSEEKFYDRVTIQSLKLAIAEKERAGQQAIVDKNLKSSIQSVKATWALVLVTLGLVITTAILAYITYIKK